MPHASGQLDIQAVSVRFVEAGWIAGQIESPAKRLASFLVETCSDTAAKVPAGYHTQSASRLEKVVSAHAIIAGIEASNTSNLRSRSLTQ